MEETLTELRRGRDALLRLVDDVTHVWSAFAGSTRIGVAEADEAEGLIAEELAVVRDTLARQRLNVGVFGLIKRGKSTLVNALVGADVSATAATPETAVPVYVEHGEAATATVHFADGAQEEMDPASARAYTSQQGNLDNQRGVTHVRVRTPAPLLDAGIRLVDTPGLDDADVDDIYTRRTLQELESVDVGIVVILSALSVGATEAAFLREVVAQASEKVIVVVNMLPEHYYDEVSRTEILDYVSRRVEEHVADGLALFPVCALDAWEARRAGFEERWALSGAADLLAALEGELSTGAGREALDAAASRLDNAVDLAEHEVSTRRNLLADPGALETYRDRTRRRIASFAGELEAEIESRLARVEPLRIHHRSLLLSIVYAAKQRVQDADDIDDLREVLRRFRREAEVAGNQASQQFFSTMAGLLEELSADVGDRSASVMAGLAADLDAQTSGRGALDHLSVDPGVNPAVGGAAVGALVAGGVGFAVVSMLGPLGLVAGALAGWRLGDVIGSGRSVSKAREIALERLDLVSDELASAFDEKVDAFVEAVHEAVRRRPRGLRADLERQLAAIEEFVRNPELLEDRRRDYDRLLTDLGAVRREVRDILPTPLPSA